MELYDCTMEEAVNVIRGKVYDWRIQRSCANLIHRSLVEKPVNILEEIPLPYDDEIDEVEDDVEKLYNEAKEKGIV